MEIEDIRQELNDLLESVVDHSGKYGAESSIPSLEIGFVLGKINKMQENLTILKYLLEQKEKYSKAIIKNESNQDVTTKTEVQEEVETLIEEDVVIEKVIVPEEKPETLKKEENRLLTPEIKEVTNTVQPTNTKLIDILTLNDRYLYANELFAKDMNAFNDFVKKIDNASDLNTAKEHLFALNLDMDNEHVASFFELMDRRFLKK